MARFTFLLIWSFLLAILVLRFFFLINAQRSNSEETIIVTATLRNEPTVKGNVQQFEVIHHGQRIQVWTARFPEYHYGDVIKISGRLEANTGRKSNVLPNSFRTYVNAYFPKIERVKRAFSFLAVVEDVRQHIILTIRQVLPANESALLAGILLGSKEGFSKEFYQALRNTGTLHVVAASGMNVSLLASFMMAILLRMFKRRTAAAFTVLAIILYTFLASLQPAIIRAAIMGIALFTGSILNRQTHAGWILGIACYTMLLFDPLLIFDIGFQLSFAATAGLLFLTPVLEEKVELFKKIRQIHIIGESATTTVVAQIATLPVILANFGSVSILSIPVNTLILWTSQPLMFLGLIAALLSFIPVFSYLVLLATFPLLTFFEKTVLLFNQPKFLVTVAFSPIISVGYYMLLIAGYFSLKKGNDWYESK